MAKKKRTPRKLSWKEALVVIALAMILVGILVYAL